jgi:hypothetical protein
LRGLRGGRREEYVLYVKKVTRRESCLQLKGGGNATIKGKILEQDLPRIIKNIAHKMIIVCCKFRKLEKLV